MPREVMRRRASDNEYFHPDFHGALSVGLDYIAERWGDEDAREYLRRFTRRFYAPVREDIAGRGLRALKDHYEDVYRREHGGVLIRLGEDELVVEVPRCPAVAHMREHGYPVSRLWPETIRTVGKTLCEGTSYEAELVEYQPETGHSVMRFRRERP